MQAPTHVFCDWTFVDAAGRFAMLSLWGYCMGKSVVSTARVNFCLTFGGVLSIAMIHTLMQPGGWVSYFIKAFLFYLTAAVIGYRPGRRKAERIKVNLDRMQEAIHRMESRRPDESDNPAPHQEDK